MVKATLLQSQNQTGQEEPGGNDGDTRFSLNITDFDFDEQCCSHSGNVAQVMSKRFEQDT